MDVDPLTATASEQVDGQTYYFCSEDCYRTFTADPTTYLT
jgi:Cu+-exporting ATPase